MKNTVLSYSVLFVSTVFVVILVSMDKGDGLGYWVSGYFIGVCLYLIASGAYCLKLRRKVGYVFVFFGLISLFIAYNHLSVHYYYLRHEANKARI